METRDQWYKPNLLYNIHYRPPKKPEPPKMIVETVQFNPSVCTCGEHGCQPQYRMERRVLWTNKEVCNAKSRSMVNDREKKNEYRESKFDERITKQDGRKISKVIESEQMGLKEENGQEFNFMIEGDGNKCGSSESFKEIMPGDVGVKSGYKENYAVKEKENVEGNDDEMEKKEECVCMNEVGYSDSKGDICIEKEANNTNNIKENISNGRSDRDNLEGRNNEEIYRQKCTENDLENIYNNDCRLDGKNYKDHQMNKDQTTEEGGGAVEKAGAAANDDEEYCSDNRILINNSGETAESYIESEDGGLEDVEIASAFGIMSIYCNSELHSWVSFEGEDD